MATAVTARSKGKRRWTYDEMLAKLPETNQPIELWDGELVMSPAPHPNHQRIILRIARLLEDFVVSRKLGEVFISPLDVVFSQQRVTQPDVFFVSNAKRAIIQDRVRGVPDLLVEVISQGTWRKDRIEKKALYEQFGVAEYWIVDPEPKAIGVFALVDGTYRLHSKGTDTAPALSRLLKGLSMACHEILF